MKYIYLTFEDQSVWRLPLEIVARNKAEYYHERDSQTTAGNIYEDEYNFVMTDDFEGIDWMQNAMEWDEISDHLELVESAPVDDRRSLEFPNMDSEIKESDE